MDGILVVNKPKHWTSRDVVNKLNRILGEKKIGHTGTLDPIATGVLVICIGKYTKLVSELTSQDKEYIVEMKLGIKTDTQDITGKVIATDDKIITKKDILDCFQRFPKTYLQKVPLYSAVKIKGKKLYEYAREGKEVEVPERKVNIYNLELLDYNNGIIKFKTLVSKGTYIRSLIEDIASKMETIATMQKLIRSKQGKWSLEDAIDLECIDSNNSKTLLSLTDIFDYEIITIKNSDLVKYQNGNKVYCDYKDGRYFIQNGNSIIGIYEFQNYLGKPIFLC